MSRDCLGVYGKDFFPFPGESHCDISSSGGIPANGVHPSAIVTSRAQLTRGRSSQSHTKLLELSNETNPNERDSNKNCNYTNNGGNSNGNDGYNGDGSGGRGSAKVSISPFAVMTGSNMVIGEHARIGTHAVLGTNVVIGAFCDIGAMCEIGGKRIEIGENVTIGARTSIIGDVVISDGAVIGRNCIIGSPGNDRGNSDGPAGPIVIRENAVIRDNVTIDAPCGTTGEQPATIIGENCYLMTNSTVSHDCRLSENVTLSPGATLAGTVQCLKNANIGMGAKIHQRTTVGAFAMVGMGHNVVKDVPPCVTLKGVNNAFSAINEVGLERAGFSRDAIESLKGAFWGNKVLDSEQAIEMLMDHKIWSKMYRDFAKARVNMGRKLARRDDSQQQK